MSFDLGAPNRLGEGLIAATGLAAPLSEYGCTKSRKEILLRSPEEFAVRAENLSRLLCAFLML